jgi:hypothetical protein
VVPQGTRSTSSAWRTIGPSSGRTDGRSEPGLADHRPECAASSLATGSDKEEAQFAWLDVEIERGRGPVGVMLHNLFRNGPFDSEAHVRYVPGRPRRRLLDALARRHLCCVVAGHTHRLRRLE